MELISYGSGIAKRLTASFFATLCGFASSEERGRAHLPDHELFRVEVLILTGKAFKVRIPSKRRSL
jgi:hypothetical protein